MSDAYKIKSLLAQMQLASDAPNEPAWRELRLARYAIEELERENQQLREANRVANEMIGNQANENDRTVGKLREEIERYKTGMELMEFGKYGRVDLTATILGLREELKQCAVALDRLWEDDEMGWIVDAQTSECVKCGAKGLTALPLPHDEGCVQGYIYKVRQLPSVQAALKEAGQSGPTEDAKA